MGAAATRMRRARRAAGGVVQRVGGGGRCPGFGTAKKGGKWLRRRGLRACVRIERRAGVDSAEGAVGRRTRQGMRAAGMGVGRGAVGERGRREGHGARPEGGCRRAEGGCRSEGGGWVTQGRGLPQRGRWVERARGLPCGWRGGGAGAPGAKGVGARAAGGATLRWVEGAAGRASGCRVRGHGREFDSEGAAPPGAGGRTKVLPIRGSVGTLHRVMVGESATSMWVKSAGATLLDAEVASMTDHTGRPPQRGPVGLTT